MWRLPWVPSHVAGVTLQFNCGWRLNFWLHECTGRLLADGLLLPFVVVVALPVHAVPVATMAVPVAAVAVPVAAACPWYLERAVLLLALKLLGEQLAKRFPLNGSPFLPRRSYGASVASHLVLQTCLSLGASVVLTAGLVAILFLYVFDAVTGVLPVLVRFLRRKPCHASGDCVHRGNDMLDVLPLVSLVVG